MPSKGYKHPEGCTCRVHSVEYRQASRDRAKRQFEREGGSEARAERTRQQWAKKTPEERAAIAEKAAKQLRGRTQSPETKAKRAESLRKAWANKTSEERHARVEAALQARSGRRISVAEVDLGVVLEAAGIRYEHQAIIGRYTVDYLLLDHPLVIEVDGAYWHDVEKDAARDEQLASLGLEVLRIDATQVGKHPWRALTTALIAWGAARGV